MNGSAAASGFLGIWLLGYSNPARMADALKGRPAPLWGFVATLIRGLLDSLIIYLPAALRGGKPWPESFIPVLPNEHYFAALVGIAPLFFLFSWLYLAAVIHLVLRLTRRASDIDQILNISGMAALTVGAFLVIVDTAWILAGWQNQVALGLVHLAFATWGWVLLVVGLKRLLSVPVWLGILLSLLTAVVGYPFNMIIMRAPF